MYTTSDNFGLHSFGTTVDPWKTNKIHSVLYRVSHEERAKLREGVPYVKLYRYNPKTYIQS